MSKTIDYLEHPSPEMVDIALAELSMAEFGKQAWKVIEPATEYKHNWHIDVICEHLEAVSRGELQKLIINIPPRSMKSLLISVFWPCWSWIDKPHLKWLFSSYAKGLSIRDSVKCRRLIHSAWYQERWGDRYILCDDQNEKMKYETDKYGYRLSTSVDGSNTGEGGDILVADDPHNVNDAESDTIRKNCIQWWDEVMSSRINDPKTGAKVIVMQRSHENDLTGHLLAKDLGYTHLCLPARYEGKIIKTRYFTEDPRTEIGEPLNKDRYGDKELAELENDMGEYATAAQLQQDPKPRGGFLLKVERMSIVQDINTEDIITKVRYWDKGGSEEGCFNAGVLMLKLKTGKFVIADVVRGQWSVGVREETIRQTAEQDGVITRTWIEQEPGSGGKESADNTVRNLKGFTARADKIQGSRHKSMSKEARAEPLAIEIEKGNLIVLNRPWTKDYLAELRPFPFSKNKDQVDASTGAFNKLNTRKVAGLMGRE
jgi:predicted phage terminase large subunit-like protein